MDEVARARKVIIRATMGFGSAGATKGTTGFRLDTKRSSATAQHLWAKMPDNLALVGQRFEGVLIENRNAIQVMQDHDTPDTLFYADPPYCHDLRIMAGKYYRHEMTNENHLEFLEAIKNLQGKVIVSGYDSALYNGHLSSWRKVTRESPASGRSGTVKRKECLWISPNCEDINDHSDLI